MRHEIARVVVGHDDGDRRHPDRVLRGRSRTDRRRAGHRQDADRPLARRGAGAELQPHPVHRRPDARRHHRHARDRRDAPKAAASFVFVPGPVFAHVLLADEINRATPKTQSALLEAMAEQQVTVAGTTLPACVAVLRARHAEPDRDGGHVSAARGAARSLPLQGAARVPDEARAGAHPRDDDHRRPADHPSRARTGDRAARASRS